MTESEGSLMAGLICGPHCDQRILHAPGICTTCDKFPMLQKAREIWHINFTGQRDPTLAVCPSTIERTVEEMHAWPGNRPT